MAITRIGNIANTIPDNSIANSKLTDIVNFKNIIINGDMSIAQRGTSTASITSSGYYTVDRYVTTINVAGTWTQSQDTDVPTGQGFAKSLKLDCTTANGSLSASSFLFVEQRIEGQNLQYLKKGTSSAESLTLSFWVKSNKTGTYIAELRDSDNSRNISKVYTIDSASTWEKKTITFAGDTTGAFDNNNEESLRMNFWLVAGTNYTSGTLATSWESLTTANRAVGQVNLADTVGNEWFITGVQLEAGTTASDFEFLPYDVNLQRCQRYYWHFWSKDEAAVSGASMGLGFYSNSSTLYLSGKYVTQMRATPSLDQTSGTSYYTTIGADLLDDFVIQTAGNKTTNKSYQMYNNTDVSGTTNACTLVRCNNTNAYVAFDAEL